MTPDPRSTDPLTVDPDCDCNFCRTGIRDGLGHDDGPALDYSDPGERCPVTDPFCYSDPGERCPVTDPFWCSRDRYHIGAHVSRSEIGPGMIGWPNTTEPVGYITYPASFRDHPAMPYLVVGAVAVILILWIVSRNGEWL